MKERGKNCTGKKHKLINKSSHLIVPCNGDLVKSTIGLFQCIVLLEKKEKLRTFRTKGCLEFNTFMTVRCSCFHGELQVG